MCWVQSLQQNSREKHNKPLTVNMAVTEPQSVKAKKILPQSTFFSCRCEASETLSVEEFHPKQKAQTHKGQRGYHHKKVTLEPYCSII